MTNKSPICTVGNAAPLDVSKIDGPTDPTSYRAMDADHVDDRERAVVEGSDRTIDPDRVEKPMKEVDLRDAMKMKARKTPALPTRRALPKLCRTYLRILREDGVSVRTTATLLKRVEKVAEMAAFHEAGHAVVLRYAAGVFADLVSIERGSDLLQQPGWGFTRRETSVLHHPQELVRELLTKVSPDLWAILRRGAEADVMYCLAGPAVEAMREQDGDEGYPLIEAIADEWGRFDDGYCDESDFGQAHAMLSKFESSPNRRWRWLLRLLDRTAKLVSEPDISAAITKVAEALLDKPTIEGDELVELLVCVPRRKAVGRSSVAVAGGVQ